MNKKTYITPEMEEINVMAESQMMAGSIRIDRTGRGDQMLSNDRRGGWGDLWVDGDEQSNN